MLHDDGTAEHVVVGPDLRAGQRVQLHIPGNTFHTARLLGDGHWFLGGSTEWPGVVPAKDVEIGDLDALAARVSVGRGRHAKRSPPRCATSSRPAARGRPRWLQAASPAVAAPRLVLIAAASMAASAGDGPALTTVNPDSAYPEGPTVVDGVLYYAEMGNDRVMRFDGETNSAGLGRGTRCGPTTVAPLGDGCACGSLPSRGDRGADFTGRRAPRHHRPRRRTATPSATPMRRHERRQGRRLFLLVRLVLSGRAGDRRRPSSRRVGRRCTRVAEGIHYANGVAVSPDGRTLLRLGASRPPRAGLRHR